MKHIIFLLLFLPFIGFSQGGTWPVKYNDSDPSGAPSAAGTRLYFNTATNTLFFWEPAPSSTWRKQPKSFDQITGCAAPAYTPTARQSTFAVNSCTPKPELYQWTGAAWALLNPETLYTEGTGIDITNGVITNTAPNVVQTLSIAGQDLTLSGGGGTVAIPGGASDALGTGFTAGGGSGTIPSGTFAETDNLHIGETNSGIFYNAVTPYQAANDGFHFTGFEIWNGVSGYRNVQGYLHESEQYITQSTDGTNASEISSYADGQVVIASNTSDNTSLFVFGNTGTFYTSGDGLGFQYNDDYSADFVDRSLVDKGYVDSHSGSALGTGFTAGGGSGTIPAGTVAETGLSSFIYGYDLNPDAIAWQWDNTTGNYQRIVNNADGLDIGSFDDNNSSSMRMGLSGGSGNFSAVNGTLTFNAKSNGTISFDQQECFFRFSSLDNNVIFDDTRATPLGIEYAADYSATIITNPFSITDVTSVNLLIGKKAFNGNHTATGTATTAFTVTLPTTQPDATYSVSIMPKNALSATWWYISARTTTTFTVTYLTGLTGAVDFDYIVIN